MQLITATEFRLLWTRLWLGRRDMTSPSCFPVSTKHSQENRCVVTSFKWAFTLRTPSQCQVLASTTTQNQSFLNQLQQTLQSWIQVLRTWTAVFTVSFYFLVELHLVLVSHPLLLHHLLLLGTTHHYGHLSQSKQEWQLTKCLVP